MNASLIAIVGPTASGKTALAQYLSNVFAGEIVNADSRQVYKGMNIGTAKAVPNVKLKTKNLKLHLFDILKPDEEFSVAEYKKRALTIIDNITKRGKLPFLVGGSGLYIQAIVDNLDLPEIPAQKELRTILEQKNEQELLDMLKEYDIKAARIIDVHNKRRLVRALEVSMLTGKSFSEQRKRGPKLFDILQIALNIPREQLFQNIEERTKQMIKQGLGKEVKNLVKTYGWNNILSSTIGYKEWQGYFEKEKNLEQVKDEIIKNTRLLVKKQLTWFRAQKDIYWAKNKKEAEKLVKEFLKS